MRALLFAATSAVCTASIAPIARIVVSECASLWTKVDLGPVAVLDLDLDVYLPKVRDLRVPRLSQRIGAGHMCQLSGVPLH